MADQPYPQLITFVHTHMSIRLFFRLLGDRDSHLFTYFNIIFQLRLSKATPDPPTIHMLPFHCIFLNSTLITPSTIAHGECLRTTIRCGDAGPYYSRFFVHYHTYHFSFRSITIMCALTYRVPSNLLFSKLSHTSTNYPQTQLTFIIHRASFPAISLINNNVLFTKTIMPM